MQSRLSLLMIIMCCLLFCVISCPEEENDLAFHPFYNADSNCGSSTFVYDYYGKETRVIEDSRTLYIVDDECILENTRLEELDLYIDDVHVAKVRCGYTTDGQCRYFWTHPIDGRHMVISGSCSSGYNMTFNNEQYSPC